MPASLSATSDEGDPLRGLAAARWTRDQMP